jgi:phage baseplate assembly protein V
MTLNDFSRLTDVIKRKIFLLLGRALLTAVNNAEKTQKIQVSLLKDETVSDIERFQEYGFETFPKKGSAESIIGFLNGNRDHGIVLCVHDREYRPTDLVEGDTRHYDYRGNKITCLGTGIEIECKNGNKAHLTSTGIKLECKNGNTFEMISGEVKINSTNLEVLQ